MRKLFLLPIFIIFIFTLSGCGKASKAAIKEDNFVDLEFEAETVLAVNLDSLETKDLIVESTEEMKITENVESIEIIDEYVLPTPEEFYSSLTGVWVEVTDLEDKLMLTFNEKGATEHDLVVSYIYGDIMALASVKKMTYLNDTLVMPLDLIFTEGCYNVEMTFTAKTVNEFELLVDMEELVTIYRYVAPTMEEALEVLG